MVQVYTDFESGNIGEWSPDGASRLRFKAPTDGAPWAMWFYFRLEGVPAGPFEFVLDNLEECLEATHWGDVRPVMRSVGGHWQRAASEDIALDPDANQFRFRFDLPGSPVEIAYCYPYPPAAVDALLRDLEKHPAVEVSRPSQSVRGRPIPHVVMRCTGAAAQPEILWAQSREHAGEVSGAFVLDGFLRAAATSPLRDRFEIHALPMVDVDAVAEGRYGKDVPPADHHMAWCPDGPRLETRLAMDLMDRATAHGNPFRLFLNFHSPSPENDSYLPPLNPTLYTPAQQLEAERLANILVSHSPPHFPLNVDETSYQRVAWWFGDDVEHRPEAYVLRRFGAQGILVETAYHAAPDGRLASPNVWRALGASLLRGLERHFGGPPAGRIALYDSMPPIFRQPKGWILWSIPWNTRLTFEAKSVWAVGDDPESSAYFGMPKPIPLSEVVSVRVLRRAGGQIEVTWPCYDQRGSRLFHSALPQTIMPSEESQRLALPEDLPQATRFVRPSFRLRGAFRPIEIEVD